MTTARDVKAAIAAAAWAADSHVGLADVLEVCAALEMPGVAGKP
jgi:hypothetical protein